MASTYVAAAKRAHPTGEQAGPLRATLNETAPSVAVTGQ